MLVKLRDTSEYGGLIHRVLTVGTHNRVLIDRVSANSDHHAVRDQLGGLIEWLVSHDLPTTIKTDLKAYIDSGEYNHQVYGIDKHVRTYNYVGQ